MVAMVAVVVAVVFCLVAAVVVVMVAVAMMVEVSPLTVEDGGWWMVGSNGRLMVDGGVGAVVVAVVKVMVYGGGGWWMVAVLVRMRFVLDTAMMLHHRCENLRRGPSVRYPSWDSSPQFGRDYEWALVTSITKANVQRLFACARRLQELWEPAREPMSAEEWNVLCSDDRIESEIALMSEIESGMDTIALPVTLIGFGVAGFKYKLAALCHTVRLCTWSAADFRCWMHELVSTMQDQGHM